MTEDGHKGDAQPYPAEWEQVAHLRVFRAGADEWHKVPGWRADMLRRGWKLLRITSDTRQIVAVFGKTRNHRAP